MKTIDGESDVEFGKRKHKVTSKLRHFCVNYVIEIVYVTTLVACIVFIHDTRNRQSLLEQRLSSCSSSSGEGKGEGEMGCCRCCQENREVLGESAQWNGGGDEPQAGNRNSVEKLLLSFANQDLVVDSSSDAGSSSYGRDASLPVRKPIKALRHRRDLEDLEASSSSANETEAEEGSAAVSPSSSPFSLSSSSSSSSSMTAETESMSPREVDFSSSRTRPPLRRERSSTEETIKKQRNADKTQDKEKKKKKQKKRTTGKVKHSKESETNSEHHLAAIHLQAPDNFDRKYESGPAIQVNASDTRDTVYRFWRKASWVKESVSDVFHLDNETGHVTVEVEGIYMIYAQVVYHDLSGRWSFGVYVGDQERVKCLATEQLRDLHSYHPTSHGVYQSCYTALVLHIRKNQSVSIRCLYGSRTILTRSEFTFWGIVRLS